jgi:hypothetical protein
MEETMSDLHALKKIRIAIILFMIGLVASGLTAFPLLTELRFLKRIFESAALVGISDAPHTWILSVHDGLAQTYAKYPFVAYGTDWLAFGHLAIAIFFIGPLRDPLRNVWVIQAGLVACALVIPTAVICGALRGIPFFWTLIDCSFGIFGALPLVYAFRLVRHLSRQEIYPDKSGADDLSK